MQDRLINLTTLTIEQMKLLRDTNGVKDFRSFDSIYKTKTLKEKQYVYDLNLKRYYHDNKWISRPDMYGKGKLVGKAVGKAVGKVDDFTLDKLNSQYNITDGGIHAQLLYHVYDVSVAEADIPNANDRERINYFIHFLASKSAYKYHKYMNYDSTKKLLGTNYKAHLSYLIDNSIIEKSGTLSSKGSSTYTYNAYKLCTFAVVEATTMITILTVAKSILALTLKTVDPIGYSQMITMTKVTYDISPEDYRKLRLPQFDAYCIKKIREEDTEWLSENQSIEAKEYAFNERVEHEIDFMKSFNGLTPLQKLLRTVVDAFGRRIYHVCTYTKSELRHHVKYNDTHWDLVELDIGQSQVMILADLLDKFNIKCTLVDKVNAGEDIYALIDADRPTAKDSYFKAVYGKKIGKVMGTLLTSKAVNTLQSIKGMQYSDLALMISELYGNDDDLRVWLMDFPISKLKKYKTHKNLSCILQRIESYMMRRVCKELDKKKIKYMLVHDACYVDYECTEQAKVIMEQILNIYMSVNHVVKQGEHQLIKQEK